MQLTGERAKRLLDLALVGVARDAEELVVIPFGLCHPSNVDTRPYDPEVPTVTSGDLVAGKPFGQHPLVTRAERGHAGNEPAAIGGQRNTPGAAILGAPRNPAQAFARETPDLAAQMHAVA